MKTRALFALSVLLTLLLPALPVLADGIVIPDPPPDIPITDVPFLTIKYHRVSVEIDGPVATTHVDQVFVNDAPYEVEGTYIFPLPKEAAISEFALWVDGEKVEGRVLEKDEARAIYEDIVRQRRDPALLEYIGRDAFQARVYPIPPGGERRVELEYSQVLTAEGGLIQYVYPLNTEKFSARPIEEVTIHVEIHSDQPLKAIYSSSHDVAVDRRGDFDAAVGYEAYDVKPDKDFVLYTTVSDEDFGLNLISYKQPGEDGFFLLLAAPKVEVEETEIVAKDVLFVLDTSGSMAGEKIVQAKKALRFVVESLHDEDRFNVVAFSTGVRSYASRPVPTSIRNDVLHFVDSLAASGGTDINRALLEALDSADAERPTVVIFLTDGLATEGVVETDRILSHVADAAGPNVRLFAFGVGDDVNTFLLDRLAQDHRGASAYVRPGMDIEEEVSAFYAKISTPLLSDITLDFGAIHVEDTYPYPLPDLFAGSQLVLVGRYREGGPAEITLTGVVNDAPRTFTYDDVSFRERGGDDFIPRLWAQRKIGYLLGQIRLHGESDKVIQEIVELSVRYGIITPYTSFLVDETADVLTEEGRQAVVEKEVERMATASPAPAYGADAVERAAKESTMRDANVAGETGTAQVCTVGAKTFVWRDGVWVDTSFDADRMSPVQVGLYSDDYFELLAARPEWGRYFALGSRVIVVLEGAAYEVVEGEGEPIEMPTDPAAADTPSPAGPGSSPTATPTPMVARDEVAPARTPSLFCGSLLGAALLPLAGWLLLRHR
ncbi:MAG: VIT domain-containing protein [Chloroflexota bacterium]